MVSKDLGGNRVFLGDWLCAGEESRPISYWVLQAVVLSYVKPSEFLRRIKGLPFGFEPDTCSKRVCVRSSHSNSQSYPASEKPELGLALFSTERELKATRIHIRTFLTT